MGRHIYLTWGAKMGIPYIQSEYPKLYLPNQLFFVQITLRGGFVKKLGHRAAR